MDHGSSHIGVRSPFTIFLFPGACRKKERMQIKIAPILLCTIDYDDDEKSLKQSTTLLLIQVRALVL